MLRIEARSVKRRLEDSLAIALPCQALGVAEGRPTEPGRFAVEINNAVYEHKGHSWWDDSDDGTLVSLRYLSNPVKFDYIQTIVAARRKRDPAQIRLLDVGCGGGYLAEPLARSGLEVVGIDPSPRTIETAQRHARQQGLAIDYMEGWGEDLPFQPEVFDFVCCCDVLEHVNDPGRITAEAARVLKTGGIFFYDTINRTWVSWLVMIKIMQDWKATAFLDPNIHLWRMFIKPKELIATLASNRLSNREVKGLAPGPNFIAHYLNLRRRVRGTISWKSLSRRLALRINNNCAITYLGHAVKR
jgi:2-polyprenyl-6-hydroxyphenyl methylase/3-demethylubiquinone-9 3-methyltransferase